MGRKSTKLRNTQPKRIFTTPAKSSTNNNNTINNNNNNNKVTTSNNTAGSSLGDSVKHGMATGVGFGMANAAINAIFQGGLSSNNTNIPNNSNILENNSVNNNPVENNTNLSPPDCASFIDLYSQCMKSQIHVSESNCNYLLEQFRSCTSNKSI